ncbi:hypothetical protein J1605_021956 [Eschrichtius robustus]|uniref:Uncharacterized protein n=1 Tax=Eschrichtius robustus TaxID=9764 RepID=A0AB34HCP9_ESCRO|nr:hypothetical protein J1605_021956 [Eschrichtius robustus]
MQATRVRALVWEDATCHRATRPAKFKNKNKGISLVVQWLRIRLPMQETRVRALAQEDSICRGTTKPICHNY